MFFLTPFPPAHYIRPIRKVLTGKLRPHILRHVHDQTPQHRTILQTLSNKSIISVQGKDAKQFLQGLITNDMTCLEHGCSVIYSLMLNAKGRVLYDLFFYGIKISPDNQSYLVECEKDRSGELVKYLNTYKLRKKVTFEEQPQLKMSVLFGHPLERADNPMALDWSHMHPMLSKDHSSNAVLHFSNDPRVKNWCGRLLWDSSVCGEVQRLFTADQNVSPVVQVAPEEENLFRISCYQMGIGEGAVDLPVAQCLPLECNADLLNGVSFNKGCYVGQELTARTYHTGVTRKRLMPLHFSTSSNGITPNSDILSAPSEEDSGKSVGRVRSVVGQWGLGLLRVGYVLPRVTREFGRVPLTTAGGPCHTYVPPWWPPNADLEKNVANKESA